MPSPDTQDFAVLADALAAAWEAGQRPDLAELLRGSGGLSAREFADDLQRFLAGKTVLARPVPWWLRRWRWVCRHPDLAAVGATILIAATLLLTLLGVQTVRLRGLRHALDESLETALIHQAEVGANRQEAETLRRMARETAYVAAMHYLEIPLQAGDTMESSRLLDEQVPAEDQPDVRGFEWFVLDRLHRPRPQRFPVLQAPVRCVRYSPDGNLLAAAGDSGVIQILDARTGRVGASWPSLTTTRDLAFSPDGTLVAAVGDDGRVRVLPSKGGTPQVWPVAKVPVWQVAFVGDGPGLATLDQDGNIRLVDRRQGDIAATLPSEPDSIQSMAVAADGKWLVSGDRNGTTAVWDLATRQVVYRFSEDRKRTIKCLAVSADGAMVASGRTDGGVQVARLHRPWRHQWVLFGQHFDRLQSVAFSADGRRVAGCDKSGSVRVWRLPTATVDGATPEQLSPPPEHAWQAHQGRGYAVAFHPQQARVATGGQENHVAVWELRNPQEFLSLGETGREVTEDHSLAFSPDGTILAVAAEDGVQLWNMQKRNLETRLSRNGEPRDDVAISRDGQYLATGRKSRRLVEVWCKTPEGYQFVWETTGQACDHLAFSPQADHLLVTNWDGNEAVVYDSASGRVERRITAEQCWGGEFSPDGRQLAFTELDDVVVWDWTARKPLRRLQGHYSTVTGVAFSPDGRRLASCGRDRRIHVWDTQTGTLLRTLTGHRQAIIQVAFVGNNRLVSLGEDTAILAWHSEYGVPLCSLRGWDGRGCSRLVVSPDQRWLVWRLLDGDIPLLDISRGETASTSADAPDGRP